MKNSEDIMTTVLHKTSSGSTPSEGELMDDDRRIRRKLGRVDSRTFVDRILKEASHHHRMPSRDPRRSLIRPQHLNLSYSPR